MREILDRLMKYEWFGCNTEARKGLEKELDQALIQLKSELLEKLPKEIDTIGKIDEWGTGFNSCLSQVKQVIEEALK